MATLSYIDAIRAGLFEEMRRDDSVVLIGEDIGRYGGAFKATKGLFDEFGERRVLDAPISESAIVGACIGAAIRGFRPVAEMQFADFVTCGFSQIVVNAATFHYRLGVSVPIVVRCPAGGGVAAGPYHSRAVEAWFAHGPGLKVVVPATPADAKGLMKSAIRDPNPVVFLEHEMMYGLEFDVPEVDDWLVPIGKARVRREGTDVTITAHSRMVGFALQAAEKLAEEGISCEVVDLRTLRPLDHETIVESVKKTSRLVSAEEGWGPMGVGAEVVARVIEHAFDYLDAPPMRVHQEDVPLPYAANLEVLSLPGVDKIIKAVRAVMA